MYSRRIILWYFFKALTFPREDKIKGALYFVSTCKSMSSLLLFVLYFCLSFTQLFLIIKIPSLFTLPTTLIILPFNYALLVHSKPQRARFSLD